MPSHGTETIDGIPVLIRDGSLLSFQPGAPTGTPLVRLGAYDSKAKKHTWDFETPTVAQWLEDYRNSIAPRTRASAPTTAKATK